MTPRLGSTRQNRRTRRLAVVVRTPSRRQPLRYRYVAPMRKLPTLYTQPFVSTRSETVERFRERFRAVGECMNCRPEAARARVRAALDRVQCIGPVGQALPDEVADAVIAAARGVG